MSNPTMARNKRGNRKPETDTRKPPARFVRRRRSPRKDREGGDGSHLDTNGRPVPAEADAPPGGSAGASAHRAWSRAPRPAEPPPKNPAVFSYTHTIRKSS